MACSTSFFEYASSSFSPSNTSDVAARAAATSLTKSVPVQTIPYAREILYHQYSMDPQTPINLTGLIVLKDKTLWYFGTYVVGMYIPIDT